MTSDLLESRSSVILMKSAIILISLLNAIFLPEEKIMVMATSPVPGNQNRSIIWLQKMEEADKAFGEDRIIKSREALKEALKSGEDHPYYSASLRRLTESYLDCYKMKEAERSARKELEILSKLGETYQDLVPVYITLGKCTLVRGEIEEASKNFEKALEIKNAARYNPTGLEEILLWLNLIAKLDDTDKKSPASRDKVWAAFKLVNKTNAANRLSYLAELLSHYSKHCRIPRIKKAMQNCSLEWCKRAIELAEENGQSKQSLQLDGLHRLGIIHNLAGRDDKALKCFMEAASTREKILGADNGATIDSLLSVGTKLFEYKRYDECLPVMTKVAERIERTKFINNSQLAFTYNLIALCEFYLGSYEKALQVIRKAIALDPPETDLRYALFKQEREFQRKLKESSKSGESTEIRKKQKTPQ